MDFIVHHPLRFRLLLFLGSFCLGIAAGSFFTLHQTIYLLFITLILLGLSLLSMNAFYVASILSVFFLIVGFYWSNTHLQQLLLPSSISYNGETTLISLSYNKPPRMRAVMRLEEGPYTGKLVRAYVYDWTYETGQVVIISTKIEPSLFASDRGSDIIGLANDAIVTHLTAAPNLLYRFRNRIHKHVASSLPEPYASLAIGLLTGVSDEFDPGFREDLKRTGTSHLVAVSGYNLTIVALILQRIGLRKSRRFGFILASCGIIFYLILAGTGASILRGATVAFLSLFATALGRPTHRLVLLLLSAAILSLISPLGMVYSLSWQLSFLAFAGILFINPLLNPKISKWLQVGGSSLAETVSAQLPVLPLLLYRFGLISPVAPFVNAVVLLITPLAMAISAIQAFISLFSIELGRLFAWFSYPILWAIVTPIEWASQFSFSAITIDNFSILHMGVSYGVLLFIFIWFVRYMRTNR